MRIFSSVSVHRLFFFSLAQCLITLHWWNSQENPTAAEEQEQIVVPSFVRARTSYHNTAEEIQPVGTHGMRGYMVGKNVVDKLNMHHPPWWENTSTMITQRRIKVSLAKVENNTKHKTIMPSFLLPDGLFAVRTITSFIHDCNRYCETLHCWTMWQSHDQLTMGSEILRSHKRIYLSSWPRLLSVTMPFHMVIKTITLVDFLLSWAAFTKVSAVFYTHENFT